MKVSEYRRMHARQSKFSRAKKSGKTLKVKEEKRPEWKGIEPREVNYDGEGRRI